MPSRIVLATDFSQAAAEAARMARWLAPRPEDVVVVHVLEESADSSNELYVPGGRTEVRAQTARLDSMRAKLASWTREAELAGAQPELRHGEPGAQVAAAAAAHGADLVVLGATGHSAFERVLLGTTAAATLRQTDSDVLLVRPPLGDRPPFFRRIVVATDFSPPAEAALSCAKRLAQQTDTEVILAHVRASTLAGAAVNPVAAEPRLGRENARWFDGAARVRLLEGDPSRELRRLVDEERADVLVVGRSGAGHLQRLFLGSVSQRLAEDAPCSVLVARTAPAEPTG